MARLKKLAEWLERDYPSAAASLMEGLEECFTINRFDVPVSLHRCLATTNIIESRIPAFVVWVLVIAAILWTIRGCGRQPQSRVRYDLISRVSQLAVTFFPGLAIQVDDFGVKSPPYFRRVIS